jgi:hypothetical protein
VVGDFENFGNVIDLGIVGLFELFEFLGLEILKI